MNKRFLRACICLITLIIVCCCSKEDMATIRIYNIPRDLMIETTDNQILVVNSEKDFEKYFNTINSKLPKGKELTSIDFKKNTLIYVQGVSNYGISELKSYMDTDSTPNVLTIDIKQSYATVLERWNVAYLINKQENPSIKLECHIGQ